MAMWTIRHYRDSVVTGLNSKVHTDVSSVVIASAKRQVVPTVRIVPGLGGRTAALVDEEKYTKFVQASVATLLSAQREIEREASELLEKRLAACFEEIHPRAEQFANWYFAYSTGLTLLQEASMSLIRHTASMNPSPINEAVAADMDKFMTKKYERIVLCPEINDARVQSAYVQCVKDVHGRYLQVVNSIDEGMIELLSHQTSHLEQPRAVDIKLSLDWASQLYKIKTVPASFEKHPELTLLLSSGGAIIGKAVASKAASLATSKVLAGKLTAPFVSKAMATAGGAAAGSIAGPVGTAMGAAIGLGVDYLVNAGIELVNREELIKDVKLVVEATKADYQRILEEELHRATRVWVEDAVHLLPRLDCKATTSAEGQGMT